MSEPQQPNGPAAETPIATFDDDSRVYLEAWSGGAHPAGPWAIVRLRFEDGAGNITRKVYSPVANAETAIPIDDKFHVWPDGLIRNRVSGEAIPHDEPLFLLRARDINALAALYRYRQVCAECKLSHLAGIDRTIGRFLQYAHANPERMKQPGVTEHIRCDECSDAAGVNVEHHEK